MPGKTFVFSVSLDQVDHDDDRWRSNASSHHRWGNETQNRSVDRTVCLLYLTDYLYLLPVLLTADDLTTTTTTNDSGKSAWHILLIALFWVLVLLALVKLVSLVVTVLRAKYARFGVGRKGKLLRAMSTDSSGEPCAQPNTTLVNGGTSGTSHPPSYTEAVTKSSSEQLNLNTEPKAITTNREEEAASSSLALIIEKDDDDENESDNASKAQVTGPSSNINNIEVEGQQPVSKADDSGEQTSAAPAATTDDQMTPVTQPVSTTTPTPTSISME